MFRTLILAGGCVALCAVHARVVHAIPIEWLASDGGNRHFYDRIVPPSGATWTEANAAASASSFHGAAGHLVTIGDAAEWNFVIATFPIDWTWIGLTDQVVEGQFQWVTGEPLTFTRWIPGEPNNAGVEDFVFYQRSGGLAGDFGWNDFSDFRNIYSPTLPIGYVVEYETPEPQAWVLAAMGACGLILVSRRSLCRV